MAIEQGAITRGAEDVKMQPAGRMEAKGRELGHKADLAGHKLRERLEGAKGRVVDRVHDSHARIAQEVRTNPGRTLLWAAGAGVLVGMLLARRANGKAIEK
jgi:ElaB/YqjD/DUF883 family membrane-anchored ribosome-binding protein